MKEYVCCKFVRGGEDTFFPLFQAIDLPYRSINDASVIALVGRPISWMPVWKECKKRPNETNMKWNISLCKVIRNENTR